jgi:hypothetical protein
MPTALGLSKKMFHNFLFTKSRPFVNTAEDSRIWNEFIREHIYFILKQEVFTGFHR